jgi:LuxR family maltose regulon positive regulatory protein
MDDVLISTKLQPPAVRRELVGRAALVERLRAGSAGRLTVVVAPPGWGKTTLLAAWRLVEGSARPFAWLSLDAGDDDPVRFWTYAAEALRGALPAVDVALPPSRALARAPVDGVVVPRLVNALAEAGDRVVLALDDYHAIGAPEVHAGLAALIEHAPPTLHVAVASRVDPELPLDRLRVRGELAELRTEELRFTSGEAAVLLNGVLDLGLSEPDVATLRRRTEGWAAGLYLAALSLRGRPDAGSFMAGFAGDDRLLVDYLSAEMLDGLRAEVRGFLVETSILERLCGPLCDAVTGRTDSARLLIDIERSNLFLVPLDRRRHWYRYHHLFGERLRHELAQREPPRVAELHARACAWHLAEGMVPEAVRHALAGGDEAAARRLVAEHWNDYFNQGRLATVRGWLDALSPGGVRGDPRLCAARAWLALDAGALEDAAPWIEAAERETSAEAAVLRAVHSFKAGSLGDATAAARLARELAPAGPGFARTVATCILGCAAYWAGDEAPALGEAREEARTTGNHLAEAYMTGYLALLAAARGDLDDGEALAAAALGLSDEPGFAEHFVLHVAHLATAVAAGRRGDGEGAASAAERAVDLAAGAGRIEAAGAWLELGRARLAVGRRAGARAALARAEELVGRCREPGTVAADVAALAAHLATAPRRSTEALTDRELEVLRLLAGPLSRREIAATLFLSPDTVKTHIRGIYRKLSASSREDAVSRGHELGVI